MYVWVCVYIYIINIIYIYIFFYVQNKLLFFVWSTSRTFCHTAILNTLIYHYVGNKWGKRNQLCLLLEPFSNKLYKSCIILYSYCPMRCIHGIISLNVKNLVRLGILWANTKCCTDSYFCKSSYDTEITCKRFTNVYSLRRIAVNFKVLLFLKNSHIRFKTY